MTIQWPLAVATSEKPAGPKTRLPVVGLAGGAGHAISSQLGGVTAPRFDNLVIDVPVDAAFAMLFEASFRARRISFVEVQLCRAGDDCTRDGATYLRYIVRAAQLTHVRILEDELTAGVAVAQLSFTYALVELHSVGVGGAGAPSSSCWSVAEALPYTPCPAPPAPNASSSDAGTAQEWQIRTGFIAP